MGVTSTGIRYPEGTDPVAAGAAAMGTLAGDVTSFYPSRTAASLTAVQPAGTNVPASSLLRIHGAQVTITLTNGAALFAIPNGGKPWTQILYFGVCGAETGTTPRNSNWAVTPSGTLGTLYVALYVANVLAGTGAVNMQYCVIGV